MPKSARPRKAYKPKGVRVPTNIRYGQLEELHLQLVPHVALDLFRTGLATEGDWHTLAVRVNWAVVMATRHHPDVVDVATAGVRALAVVMARHERIGRWGCNGEELRALGAALVLMDEMQQSHTRRDLHDALAYTLRVAGRPGVGRLMEVDA